MISICVFMIPSESGEILHRIKDSNGGPLDDEGLQRLFERVIDECRRIERLEREKKTKDLTE